MNPLDLFTRYRIVAELVVVAGAVIAFAMWWHNHNEAQQKIGYDRAVAEYQQKAVEAKAKADADAARFQKEKDDAIQAAAKREQDIKTTAAAATATVASLREQIASTGARMPAADLATARITAATLGQLFGDCAQRYTGLAEKADRHASDVKTLIESWPK